MEDKKRTWSERGMIVSAGKCIIFRDVSYLHTLLSRLRTAERLYRDWSSGRTSWWREIDKTPERTVAYCGQVQAACDRMIDSGFVSDWLPPYEDVL